MTDSRNKDNKWLSIYIFYNNNLNILLIELITPILKLWYKKGMITNHFFVRYWEGGQHIRLRIKPTKSLTKSVIIKNINDLYKSRLLNTEFHDKDFKIIFSDYIQELQRYGGIHSIKLAESFFEYSSVFVMNILKQFSQSWDNSMAISIAMQTHLLFIKEAEENTDHLIKFFDFMFYSSVLYSIKEPESTNLQEQVEANIQLFDTAYQKQEKTVDFLCKSIWEENNWLADDWRSNWITISKRTIDDYNLIEEKKLVEEPAWLREMLMPDVPKKKIIKWAIWNSYFHMTNNRIGVYLRDEPYIYFAIKKGLSHCLKVIN